MVFNKIAQKLHNILLHYTPINDTCEVIGISLQDKI